MLARLSRDASGSAAVGYLHGASGGTIALSERGWIKLLNGVLRLENGAVSDWSSNKASLDIAATASLDVYTNEATIVIDALTGLGGIVRTGAGSAVLRTGVADHVGVTDGVAQYDGAISNGNGTVAVQKEGEGTLVFGGDNTYTGSTTISEGTLRVTGTLGDATPVSVASNATYDVHASDTIGSLAGAVESLVTLGDGVILTAGGLNTDTTMAGRIVGEGGGFIKDGSGVMVLSAANGFTGDTVILDGVLQVAGSLADDTDVSVVGDGRYEVLASDRIGSLAGAPAATVLLGDGFTLSTGFSGASTTFAGVIEGNGALRKIGAGTFALTNSNTYTGGTTIVDGVLSLGEGAGGSVAGSVVGDITNNAALILNRSNAYAYPGVISGTGAVHQDGSGTTTLSAAHTYNGDTVINAGRLQVTGSLADTTGVTVNAGGVYDVDATDTVRLLQGGGDVELAAAVMLTAGDATDTTFSGVMSGDGGFEKQGAARQIFSNANTFTGNTIISAGALQLDASGRLADTTAVQLATAGVVFDVRAIDTIGSLEGVAGTLTVLADGVTLTTGGIDTDTAMGGVISGAGGLRKVGTGVFTLSAANGYAGATAVDAGTLAVTGSLSDLTAVAIASGATYRVLASDVVGSIAGAAGSSVELVGGVAFKAGSNGTSTSMAGVISGDGDFAKLGGGTLELSGANVYSGGTTIEAGTVQLGGNEAIPDGSLFTIDTGATFYLNGYTETVYRVAGSGNIHLASELRIGGDNSSYTIDPTIYGTGDLIKEGTGTITVNKPINLQSPSTVTIEAGTLAVGGGGHSGNLGTAAVVISSEALLDFNRANPYSITNPTISGSGRLTVAGGADVTLNGSVTLTAPQAAADARVAVAVAGDFTLEAGASINAAGTNPGDGVGAVNIRAKTLENNAGNALAAPGGRWLVWTTSPIDDMGEENLAYAFREYNVSYGSEPTGVGNGLMYTVAPVMGPVVFTGTLDKVYDGTVDAVLDGSAGIDTSWFDLSGASLINNDDGNSVVLNDGATATFDDKDAGARTVTFAGISFTTVDSGGKPVYGYQLASGLTFTGDGTISPRPLSLDNLTFENKVYDGLTVAVVRNDINAPIELAGLVVGEEVVFTLGAADFESKNVGTRTATVDVVLADKTVQTAGADTPDDASDNVYETFLASNYITPEHGRQASAEITKATLDVAVNDDAKFINTADSTTGFAGVRYSGFVNGETELTAEGFAAPLVSRTGTDENAGVYADVLAASAGAADNYDLSYTAGDYTIVAADELLVTLGTTTVAYGGVPVYSGTAAYRYDGQSDPTPVTITFSGTTATVTDSGGQSATFDIEPISPQNSSSGALRVGSYQLEPTALSGGTNFSGTIRLVGALAVNPRAVAIEISGADRVYDGSTAVPGGATLSVGNRISGGAQTDAVTITGAPEFVDKNAGVNKQISVSGAALSGADSGNYYIAATTFTSTATIARKMLGGIFSANEKYYDGTTSASVSGDLDAAGVVSGDTVGVTYATAEFDTPHVETQVDPNDAGNTLIVGATQVAITGIDLTGADSANYQVANSSTHTGGSQQLAAGIMPRKVTIDSFTPACIQDLRRQHLNDRDLWNQSHCSSRSGRFRPGWKRAAQFCRWICNLC